ncbi:hypothetical protein [Maricaulis parjimensis]|uniref:hypothetical protein n=1 Tax=Maricaulis parjimensis TaxID=144023 RepID=UPI00193963D1|nr:hypothetical protein [Maricaulis parjimensis]
MQDIARLIGLTGLVMTGPLAGCVTTGDAAPSGAMARPPVLSEARPGVEASAQGDSHGLPPQTLAEGACATFFWSADSAHRLLAFENETEGFARIHALGRDNGFYTPAREGGYVTGEAFSRVYVDTDRELDVRLSGTVGETLPAGQRIERAVMRVVQPNQRTLVIPVIGVYACRGAGQAPQ